MIKVELIPEKPISVRLQESQTVALGITPQAGIIKGRDAYSPYIGEAGTWICWNDTEGQWVDTGVKATGQKGDPGSDATVTAANIQNALGYTPANPSDIPKAYDDTDIRAEIAKRSILAANENVSGKKTFTYGDNKDSAISVLGKGKSGAFMQFGEPQDTNYSMMSFFRKCADDANFPNRGDVFINKDGTLKLCHRRGRTASTTSINTNGFYETAALLVGQNMLAYQTLPPGTPTSESVDNQKLDIFYDTYETNKLQTTAKDLIGAINEIYGKLLDEKAVKGIISREYIMSLIDDGSEVEY